MGRLPTTESISSGVFTWGAMRLFHQMLYLLFMLSVLLGFFYTYEVAQNMLQIQNTREHEIEVIRDYEGPPERIAI